MNAVDRVSKKYALKFLYSETPNRTGKSPIHWASEYNQVETVKLLLDNGADVNARAFPGESPLDYAWTPEMQTLLKDHGGIDLKEYIRQVTGNP